MIRIRLEGETWQDVQNQAREVAGMNRAESQVDVPHPVTENTSPPVVHTATEAAELYGEGSEIHGHAIAAANQPEKFRSSKVCVHPEPPLKEPESIAVPRTIPAIDALPQAPPPPPEADVDARGIPWDARIHAGNKAQTKDKSWKRRRGVSVEEVQRIEAELTGTPAAIPAPPTASTAQVPPPPPAPAEAPPATFDQLMREAGQRNLGITNLNALTAEVTGGQIGQIALIADKPAYIQAVYDRMAAS